MSVCNNLFCYLMFYHQITTSKVPSRMSKLFKFNTKFSKRDRRCDPFAVTFPLCCFSQFMEETSDTLPLSKSTAVSGKLVYFCCTTSPEEIIKMTVLVRFYFKKNKKQKTNLPFLKTLLTVSLCFLINGTSESRWRGAET